MCSLHLTIAVAVALLVHTAAYPVYEPGAYRGSDWQTKYGDKEAKGAKFGGSGRWVQPETRWGYPSYTTKESKPRHEAVEKAKAVAQEAEVKPLKDTSEPIVLSDLEEEDEFDLETVLFMEWAEEPGMPPGMPPYMEAAGSEVEYLFELYLYEEYEPGEAPSSAEEPLAFEYYYYYQPEPAPLPEPYYYPPVYPPAYPPEYAPYEAPVPAPEPEAVPTVTVAPPEKKAKKHKKEEPCKEEGCPCECEKGTPCYCYPTLPKRHYPGYYTPQYSPYTYYGKGYQHPYYEPEKPEKVKKPKKIKPHPKPEAEPEPEEEVHKTHKKPKKPAHVKPEPVPTVEPKKPKHPVHKEEVPEPKLPTRVGVYPAYGYPHGKYASTYKHYYYGPEEVPKYCHPPQECESEKYPGHHHGKKTEPEYEEPTKKKKCKKCRKCKRCGPCVEDEHGCAVETHDG